MQTHKYTLCAAIAVAVSSPAALAENFYVEGGIGTLIPDEILYDATDPHTTINLRGGYKITDYLSVETELMTGIDDQTVEGEFAFLPGPDNTFVQDVTLEASFGVYAKVDLPVTERLTPYFRVGYVNLSFDYEEMGIGSQELDNGPAIGIGTTFNLNDTFYVRGDYTRFDAGAIEADSLTLGVGLKF